VGGGTMTPAQSAGLNQATGDMQGSLNGQPDSYDPNSPGMPGGPTGLAGATYATPGWNISNVWGGNNPYAGWALNPSSFAPQGDSASFFNSMAQAYAGQNAGNIAGANAGAQGAINAYGQNQGNVNQSMGDLANAAAGNAPSQAQIQMQQGLQQATGQTQALANSARGGPGAWAAAQRNASTQNAQAAQNTVAQSAALRANEMATARSAYANAAQGAGAMDSSAAGAFGTYGNGMQGLSNSTMGAMLGYSQNAGQEANAQENAWNNVVSGATQNNAGNSASATGATVSAIGTGLAAMSDARQKRAIQAEDDRPRGAYEGTPRSASEEMLANIHPYSFNYKHGSGQDPNARHFGVMAQDLEKTRMGKTIVRDTPMGKHIDVTHAMGAALAGMADLHKRLARLEATEAKHGR
jgi:Chaperone of endosialidase